MATTPEGKVKDKVKALFKQHATEYVMSVMTGMNTNGEPDFTACCNGQHLSVETKAGRGVLSALQKVRLQKYAASKSLVLVINETNLDLLRDVLVLLQANRFQDARKLTNLADWL